MPPARVGLAITMQASMDVQMDVEGTPTVVECIGMEMRRSYETDPEGIGRTQWMPMQMKTWRCRWRSVRGS